MFRTTLFSLYQGALSGWLRRCVYAAAILLLLFLSPAGSHAHDEGPPFLIIVHPQVKHDTLAREVVADALLKKRTRWEDGSSVSPVDLHSQSSIREAFSYAVLKRSVPAVRSYWQQQIFSGRGVPPPEVKSDEAAVRYVATHPGGIGYVSRKAEAKGVRIIRLRD